LGTAVKPLGELLRILRGEFAVADFLGEFDDGGGAHSPIKVLVKKDFGKPLKIESLG